MNDLSPNPRITPGGNRPPIAKPSGAEDLIADLDVRHIEFSDRFLQLCASAERAPSKIESDEICGKIQDLVKQIRVLEGSMDSTRKIETEPYKDAAKTVDAWFVKKQVALSESDKKKPPGWKEKLTARIDVWLEEKAAAERIRREEAARLERERAEELARQAAKAEQEKIEAQRKLQEEQRKLAETEAARLKAIEDAAKAEAAAAAAKAEAARIERQRKIDEDAEKERRRLQAIEDDRLAKERAARAVADAEAEAQRKVEREAEEARIADAKAKREAEELELARLKALREEEDLKATRARAQAAEFRRDETAGKASVKAATGEVRDATKDTKSLLDQAVRAEKRAGKLDDAAGASDSNLAQTRSDYGSVGTLATTWKYRINDYEHVDLEKLRLFLNPDAVGAAIHKFMMTGNRDLRGVEFYEDTSARVI